MILRDMSMQCYGMNYFHETGCRFPDHGLETMHAEEYTGRELKSAIGRLVDVKPVSQAERLRLKSALLYELLS